MNRLFVALTLTVLLSSYAFTQTGLKVGSQAPLFSVSSMDGSCNDLNELRGSVVVLTFWSTRCAICHHEFPKLNKVAQSFAGKDVVFLSLTMENEAKVEAYLKKNQLATRILPNSFGVVLQYADTNKEGNRDMGFPAFFVIDREGVVQYRSSGFDKTSSLSTTIERLVKK